MHPPVGNAVLLLMCISAAAECRYLSTRRLCRNYLDVPCDDGWSRLDENRCVKYINSSKTFHEAQEHCRSLTGDLVCLHGDDEMSKVICLTWRADPRHRGIWIGAQRSGTDIKYIDGYEFKVPVRHRDDSSNYHGSEACIKMNVKDWGSYNDIRCSKKKHFVCAKNVMTSTPVAGPSVLQPSPVPDGPQPSPVPV